MSALLGIEQSENQQRRQLLALRQLPSQLRARKRFDELSDLLTNYEFIEEKCNARMAYDLAQDYTSTLDAFPEAQRKTERYESLKIVGDAIRLSAHVVNNRPSELPSQFSGRLVGTRVPGVERLLRDVAPPFMWVKSLTRALVQADSLLAAQIPFDGEPQQFLVSPDCTRAIVEDQDHRLTVWDLKAALPLRTISPLPGHKWLAIASTGNYAFTHNDSHSLQQLWDLQTGQVIRESYDRSSQMVLSTDGRLYVSYTYDPVRNSGILSAHETRSGTVLSKLDSNSQFTSAPSRIALTDSGRTAIMVWGSRFAMVWHLSVLTDNYHAITFPPSDSPIVICPSGCHVVGYTQPLTSHGSKGLLLWLDTCTGAAKKSNIEAKMLLSATHEAAILSTGDAFSPSVTVFDLEKCVERFSLIHDSEVKHASAAGDFVLTATIEGTLTLWDIASGHKVLTLCGAAGPIRSRGIPSVLRLGSSGDRATSLDNEGLKIWRTDQRNPQDSAGHHAAVTALAAAATGGSLVSGGADWNAKLWATDRAVEITSIKVPRAIESLTIAADGRWVALLCRDALLRVWDVSSRRIVGTLFLERSALNTSAVGIFGDTCEVLIRTENQLELANWQGRRRKPVAALPAGAQHAVSLTKIGPVFYWYDNGNVFCWRREDGVAKLLSVNSAAEPALMAASAECNKIALWWAREERRGIELWDIQTGSISWRIDKPPGSGNKLSFSRGGFSYTIDRPPGSRNILSLSPSGLYVMISAGGGFVEVLRAAEATSSATFHAEAEITVGSFAGRDDMLCLGDDLGGVHLLHINEPAS